MRKIKNVVFVFLILFGGKNLFAQEVVENKSSQENTTQTEINYIEENQQDEESKNQDGLVFENREPIINLFTNQQNWSLAGRAKVNNYHDFHLYTLAFAVTGQLDMKELVVKSGVDLGDHQANLTFQANYAPTFWNVLNAGVSLINHFSWYYEEYYEFDFLIGLYLSYSPCHWFNTKFSWYYQLKNTCIYDLIGTGCEFFKSNCPAFSWEFNFYPLNWFSVHLSLSSFDFYKYYLFFAPDVRLSLGFKANEHLSITVTGEAQFVDFFTLSANFNNLSGSVSAIWRF